MKKLCVFVIAISAVCSVHAQTYAYKTIYNFQLNGTGPAYPNSLIRDSAGNLYGTSLQGGKSNAGTVFKITPRGVLTVLHTFNGTTDGSAPNSVARDIRQGNLYGTTSNTVFKMTLQKNGTYKFSTIFNDSANLLLGAATIDSKGNLFGAGQHCFASEPCLWKYLLRERGEVCILTLAGLLTLPAMFSSTRMVPNTWPLVMLISLAEVTF